MPRATPAWLVTITTARPARFRIRTASTLYGKNTSRSRRSRSPASSRTVPSRSRNTAGPAECNMLLHGIENRRRVDPLHAAVIDRALAQHARAAEHVAQDDVA